MQITSQNNHDIIFVRHAQSQLNLASHEYRVKHDLPYIWELLCKHQEFLSQVKYNPDFLDCHITKNGIEQCQNARKICDTITPDVILVSPLERTLETCNNIFGGRNIPIIVQPLLGQAFRSSCDIALDLAGKAQRFPSYNFENAYRQGDLWFIKNQSPQQQQKYNQILSSLPENSTHLAKMQAILKFMTQTFTFQTPLNMRNRVAKIKELLKSYKKQYKTIAIVAHYNTINYSVAKTFNQANQPADSANVYNCEVYMDSLEEMLKYQ